MGFPEKWKKLPVMKTAAVFLIMICTVLFLSEMPMMDAESVQDIEQGKKILVLNYHKVDDSFNSLAIPPKLFEQQMEYLDSQGYHTISPDELYQGLAGEADLPPNPVLITFDDGYVDNYTNAYPILKNHNMKATIFVVPGFTNVNKGYLTWDQMLEMEQNGITIESHTLHHKALEGLSDDQIITELRDSKEQLEERLGHPVEYLAYPTGTYNLHIASLAKEAGYRAAFTVKYGNVDQGSNIYALERVPIFRTERTMHDFYARLQFRPLLEGYGWLKN